MRYPRLLQLRFLFVGIFLSSHLYGQRPDVTEVNFARADSVAALYKGHSLDDLKALAGHLTQPLADDVQKFRSIYKWVCDNIENDPHNFQKPAIKRRRYRNDPQQLAEWNREFSREVFRRLRRDRKTICTGYASLVKEMAYHAGITCRIVDGYGRTAYSKAKGGRLPNHSWNAVFLNGRWYLCDPTWSSGSINLQEAKFLREFGEMYFLTEPSLFALNHYPLDTTWLLTTDKPSLTDFFSGPLIYKASVRHQLHPVFPKTFEVTSKVGEPFTLNVRTVKTLDPKNLKMQIVRGGYSQYPDVEVREGPVGQYVIEYPFGRRGVYTVHLMYENEYLVTYSVRVER